MASLEQRDQRRIGPGHGPHTERWDRREFRFRGAKFSPGCDRDRLRNRKQRATGCVTFECDDAIAEVTIKAVLEPACECPIDAEERAVGDKPDGAAIKGVERVSFAPGDGDAGAVKDRFHVQSHPNQGIAD